MKDEDKTKDQLINELIELRQRNSKPESLKDELRKTKEELERANNLAEFTQNS